jgi:hypothetical protein
MAHVTDTVALRFSNRINCPNFIVQYKAWNNPTHCKTDPHQITRILFLSKSHFKSLSERNFNHTSECFCSRSRQHSEIANSRIMSLSQKYLSPSILPDVTVNSRTCLHNGFRIRNESSLMLYPRSRSEFMKPKWRTSMPHLIHSPLLFRMQIPVQGGPLNIRQTYFNNHVIISRLFNAATCFDILTGHHQANYSVHQT